MKGKNSWKVFTKVINFSLKLCQHTGIVPTLPGRANFNICSTLLKKQLVMCLIQPSQRIQKILLQSVPRSRACLQPGVTPSTRTACCASSASSAPWWLRNQATTSKPRSSRTSSGRDLQEVWIQLGILSSPTISFKGWSQKERGNSNLVVVCGLSLVLWR